MELSEAISHASQTHSGVLITLRRDGRAQSSDIAYAENDGVFAISLTTSRAKTHNMRRDNRVLLHITQPERYTYLSFDGTVELLPVAAEPGDATCAALRQYYRAVSGEHDDWDDYDRAMVNDGRLLALFTPASVTGMING